MFELLKTDSHTKARLGRLTTTRGVVETPVFMPVGTQASVKALDTRELLEMQPQARAKALIKVRQLEQSFLTPLEHLRAPP